MNGWNAWIIAGSIEPFDAVEIRLEKGLEEKDV